MSFYTDQTEKKNRESISYPAVKQDISLTNWINLSKNSVNWDYIPAVFDQNLKLCNVTLTISTTYPLPLSVHRNIHCFRTP